MLKKINLFLVMGIAFSSFGQAVKNVGSMAEMGKQNFAPNLKLDTILNKKHLFGMGPYGKMQGEITVFDGKPFYSSVDEKGRGVVSANWEIESPFFVYSNVENWIEIEVSTDFKSLDDIQKVIGETAQSKGYNLKNAFPFRIKGDFDQMITHIVMPRSSEINGFQEGKKQADYVLDNQKGELLGFYSENHQGVFTPKNSFIHVHFLSDDFATMGHLDKINVSKKTFKIMLPSFFEKKAHVNDTDFSKGRLGNIQQINLDDIQKLHGHLCDGLIEGYLALNLALETLYEGKPFDRTNTRIVSKSSPCLTDAAIYLTGGRYQFNTFYVDNSFDGMYIIQRIDNLKTVLVKRKPKVKPEIIDKMGAKAIKGELEACEIDDLKKLEDDYSLKLMQSNASELFEIKEVQDFKWKSPLKKYFVKTDILNKNKIECR
jgi:alpha-acetolactate decarboxylase